MATFKVNGVEQNLDIEPEMPLLWALRDELGMTGTKFGCGIASCGACTVHVNGSAVRSCVTPVSAVQGQEITTIEGLDSCRGCEPIRARSKCCAASMDRLPGAAVRLLSVWDDHGRIIITRHEPEP